MKKYILGLSLLFASCPWIVFAMDDDSIEIIVETEDIEVDDLDMVST